MFCTFFGVLLLRESEYVGELEPTCFLDLTSRDATCVSWIPNAQLMTRSSTAEKRLLLVRASYSLSVTGSCLHNMSHFYGYLNPISLKIGELLLPFPCRCAASSLAKDRALFHTGVSELVPILLGSLL